MARRRQKLMGKEDNARLVRGQLSCIAKDRGLLATFLDDLRVRRLSLRVRLLRLRDRLLDLRGRDFRVARV